MSTLAAYTPVDFNQDCVVDVQDLLLLAANWAGCTNTLTFCQ